MLLMQQSNETTRVYASRENTLMALWLETEGKHQLLLSFESDMLPSGYALLSADEIGHFAKNLSRFFTDGKFVYGQSNVRTRELPQVWMSTTNWGEPYDQGLIVAFNEDFDTQVSHLGFALVERDVKDLHNWLQGRLEQEES